MEKQRNNKNRYDSKAKQFSQFKQELNVNSQQFFIQNKIYQNCVRLSQKSYENCRQIKNNFSQNKITAIVTNKFTTNDLTKFTKNRQNKFSGNKIILKQFDEFQEEEFKLPEIKGNSLSNKVVQNYVYKYLKLPRVRQQQLLEIKAREKKFKSFATQRIPQRVQQNYVSSNQNNSSSYKRLESLHQKSDNSYNRIHSLNEDQFLLYLKAKNSNAKQQQKTKKQTQNLDKIIKQKLNLNDKKQMTKKENKIQDIKKQTQQRKNHQRKIKLQQFFEKAKKNTVFQKIINKYQNKQVDIFQDYENLYRKKILIQKSQYDTPKIKVSMQVLQKGEPTSAQEQIDRTPKSRIINIQKTWQNLETMEGQCPQLSRLISSEIMNEPVNENELKKSRIMKEKLTKKVKDQSVIDQFAMLLIKVVQAMQQRGKTVVMTEKSTLKSQISLRALIGGYMDDSIRVQETIADQDSSCPFLYNQLQDPDVFQKFSVWYKLKTADEIGLDPNNIVIHCVAKGSIRVQWSTNQGHQLNNAFRKRPYLQRRFTLHHFFQSYELSPEDFDPRGNIQFHSERYDILQRGGWPYYQPVRCKRYGINVKGKYDNGNDRWLQMRGQPGEWAVAFHAVRVPNQRIDGGKKTRLESIMSGIEKNTMLSPGFNNTYENDTPVNDPDGEKIGKGIYCTPHIQQTFPYTCSPNEEYKSASRDYGLVFQCRVNSKKIKVASKNFYWVINHTKDIRPYGIILIKKETFKDYPTVQNQFKQHFKYDKFKKYIEKFRLKTIIYEIKASLQRGNQLI